MTSLSSSPPGVAHGGHNRTSRYHKSWSACITRNGIHLTSKRLVRDGAIQPDVCFTSAHFISSVLSTCSRASAMVISPTVNLRWTSQMDCAHTCLEGVSWRGSTLLGLTWAHRLSSRSTHVQIIVIEAKQQHDCIGLNETQVRCSYGNALLADGAILPGFHFTSVHFIGQV
jgi:hypothetical protein